MHERNFALVSVDQVIKKLLAINPCSQPAQFHHAPSCDCSPIGSSDTGAQDARKGGVNFHWLNQRRQIREGNMRRACG